MGFRPSRRVTREAHAAALRTYAENFTEAERLALTARCEADPVFKARYVEAHQLLGALDDWRDELREDTMYRSFQGRPRTARRTLGNVATTGLAAGVLLLVGIWLVWAGYFGGSAEVSRHATRVGEQRTLALEDGSRITLNTGSQILVGMTNAARRTVMDWGEAYFEVVGDPLRPFTVEVGGRSITAHGTEFNLRRREDGFTVALVEGRLAMHRQGTAPPAEPPWLDPAGHPDGIESPAGVEIGLRSGTVLDFDSRDQVLRARHEPEVARWQQWRKGQLSFRDEPMSTVIAELSRYSDKPIRIGDARVADIRVFATLRLDSIDSALSTLERAVPIRVVPSPAEIVVLAGDADSATVPR